MNSSNEKSSTPTNAAVDNVTDTQLSTSTGTAAPPSTSTIGAAARLLCVNVSTSSRASASNNGMQEQPETPPTLNARRNQAAQVSPPTEEKQDDSASSVVRLRPPSIVRRIVGADPGSKSEEAENVASKTSSPEFSGDASDLHQKPRATAVTTIRQKRRHVTSPDDGDKEDDLGCTKSPTKKLRSDSSDLSLSDDTDAYIDALVSNGTIPGPTHASLPTTGPSLRSHVRENIWQPTQESRSTRHHRRVSQKSSKKTDSKMPKGKKSKPQPLPVNQKHALKLLGDKQKAIKGMSTKVRNLARTAVLHARMLYHAKSIFENKNVVSSFGGQQPNFGYQLYRLIRPELTYEENEDLNWEDVALLEDDFFGLSGGVSMDDLEGLYQAEKKKEEDN